MSVGKKSAAKKFVRSFRLQKSGKDGIIII